MRLFCDVQFVVGNIEVDVHFFITIHPIMKRYCELSTGDQDSIFYMETYIAKIEINVGTKNWMLLLMVVPNRYFIT